MERGRAVVRSLVGNSDRVFSTGPSWSGARWAVPTIVLVGLVVGLLRIGVRDAVDSIWAEDGSIFLADASIKPIIQTLLTPYGGYAHGLPRLLAPLAALGPPTIAATVLNVSTVAVVTALAVIIYAATSGNVVNDVVRWAFALFVVVQPIASEVLVSLANLQWYLLFTALVVLLWASASISAVATGSIVCLLAATSSPFALVLLPVAALRVFVMRDVRGAVAPLALVAGVGVQLAVMLTAPSRTIDPETSPLRLAGWYLGRVAGPTFFGSRGAGSGIDIRSIGLGIVGLALLFVSFMMCSRAARIQMWPLLVVTSGYSAIFFIVPTATAGSPPPRYAVPAGLAIAFTFAIILSRLVGDLTHSNSRSKRWRRPILFGIIAATVIGWILAIPAVRAPAGSWVESVRTAASQCDADPSVVEVAIPIAPDGWHAVLPCSELAAEFR